MNGAGRISDDSVEVGAFHGDVQLFDVQIALLLYVFLQELLRLLNRQTIL